ncbi:ABC transporter substrate-binding protein [uncultured Nitratireductor sp.]|uniref:ABC transporter substrate-binding protein n=1 Tax=uncultured Nitratireductor sp. TaxID=520953 RepID=UPI0025FCDAA1|nr:ABC transporter substrate-binding protein [uncultured Nitratireductor sp.]
MTAAISLVRLLVPLSAMCLIVAGCGAEVEDSEAEARSVSVKRCGEDVEYTIPQRTVAYEGGSADKLFVLGLTDHVLGYVMPPANPPVSESPWAEEYKKVEFLGDDLLNRELVVDANADFVVAGWNSGFADQRGITPEILDRLGIMSFMHTESCFNYPNYPEHVEPFEALFTDMLRLGKIFDVEDRAAEVVSDMRRRVDAVQEQIPDREPVPVFLYDSGEDQPFTAANQVPPNEIISRAGGRNIFDEVEARWTRVSWESVVQAEPEVIVILDYGDKPAEEKIAFLKSNPMLATLPAILNDRFFILNFNEGISGPRNIDGLEKFAAYMRSLVF